GDGYPDIVVTTNGDLNSNDVSVLLGKGNGTFQGPQRFAVGGFPSAVAVADLNGDAHPHLVTANGGSHDVSGLLPQSTSGTSQVTPNDPDVGQSQTFAVTTPPAHGTATVTATGLVKYTPPPDFTGSDSLVVTVTDNGTPPLSGSVTISITVTPGPNRSPAP